MKYLYNIDHNQDTQNWGPLGSKDYVKALKDKAIRFAEKYNGKLYEVIHENGSVNVGFYYLLATNEKITKWIPEQFTKEDIEQAYPETKGLVSKLIPILIRENVIVEVSFDGPDKEPDYSETYLDSMLD